MSLRTPTMLAPAAALAALLAACGPAAPRPGAAGHTATASGAAPADSDADGVPDLVDLCPNAGKAGHTDPAGCPDADLDGVRDADDRCARTPRGSVVDDRGCPIRRTAPPEQRLRAIVPEAERAALLVALAAARPHPTRCPGDAFAPPAPEVVEPALWSVELSRVWHAGASLRIRWKGVSDPCTPVTYGVEVWRRRYVSGARWELVTRKRGLTATSVTVPWTVHAWGRYRVEARDANGNRSAASGWRYVTFAGPDRPKRDRITRPPFPR